MSFVDHLDGETLPCTLSVLYCTLCTALIMEMSMALLFTGVKPLMLSIISKEFHTIQFIF